MKLPAYKSEGFVKNPDLNLGLILIYGPNQGAVRSFAKTLSKKSLGKDADELQCITLSESDFSETPSCLHDEAKEVSMFGDKKVIMLSRENGRLMDKPVCSYLENMEQQVLVIIEAGSLKPALKIRKSVEAHKNAMALPCYEDDARVLEAMIRQKLSAQSLRIDMQGLTFLKEHLGMDRGVSEQELEKLILYMGGSEKSEPKMIRHEDIEACLGDTGSASLDKLVDAIALGDIEAADKTGTTLLEMGMGAEAFFILTRRHFCNLHLCLGQMKKMPREEALRYSFRPLLHFKRKPKIERQLTLWTQPKIETALKILTQAEAQTRRQSPLTQTLWQTTMLRLSRAAR